jgi:hypothetical protein
MPKRKVTESQKIPLYARVESYDVRSSLGFNLHLLGYIRDHIEDDTQVFESTTQLIVRGIFSEPKDRVGEHIELTLHGQKTPRYDLQVKDIHARDKDNRHLYRTYRGGRIPVLDMPAGIATIERRRSDRNIWAAWVFVEPRLVTNILMILTSGRATFLSLYERKADRRRWLTNIDLQTTDPSAED